MASVDAYYTPQEIADGLLAAAGPDEPGSVADFAAGDGGLLRAAAKKWSKAQFIATDIDEDRLVALREEYPSWLVGGVDFLSGQSREVCPALSGMQGSIECILMNPPFSCRGGRRLQVDLMSRSFRCSVATAFLLIALSYLRDEGQLLAILPAGCLVSDKDADAWQYISRNYKVDMLAEHERDTFDGCFPRTVSVRIRAVNSLDESRLPLPSPIIASGLAVSLVRGGVQMHSVGRIVSPLGVPLIHSTELRGGSLEAPRFYIRSANSVVTGPAVLMPRVGRPSLGKVCIYRDKKKVALSDCVIAIKCKDEVEAELLYSELRRNWAILERLYSGTGAPYITLSKLERFLKGLEIAAAK